MLSLGIGVNGRKNVSLYDADAQAFINATALTGTTEKTAVNNLVKNLKSYGLWSKMKAIYPFVSDTYNMFGYTEDFTNGAWAKTNITATANQTTAPNGTLTADLLTTTSTSAECSVRYTYVSAGMNLTQTTSVYVKKGTGRWLRIRNIFVPSLNGNAWFDLDNGVVGTVQDSQTATITSVGNGWYRCTLTGGKAVSTYDYVDIGFTDTNGTSWPSASVTGYLWGAQLEVSATASTYQPIATTPANRFVSQFKYNLKDARDLDAAFRLAFNGGWTYSKQGAKANGTSAYANTYYNTSVNSITNSNTIGFYANIANTSALSDPSSMGNVRISDLNGSTMTASGTSMSTRLNNAPIAGTISGATGLFTATRQSATVTKLFKNATQIATGNSGGVPINETVFIGNSNIGGSPYAAGYVNNQFTFAHMSDGLSDSEVSNLYTSVQLFQQELSRYTGVPIVSDANAQAFLDAAVITDQTQANAVNTLVTDLKTYGLWTKMKAIYPFVGGTATTHKWNLKDPRDLDAAYRLAFSGAWTHSSTGALPNGANAYADSFLTPLSALINNNTHLSYYSRTNTNGTFADMGVSGVGPAYTPLLAMYIRDTDNMATRMYGYDTGENFQSANTNSQGLFIGNRTSSTVLNQWKNSTKLGTATYTNGRNITTLNSKTYIGAINLGGTASQYTNRESAFASIGDGLSDTEATNLYTAVQKYQTSLSRQV